MAESLQNFLGKLSTNQLRTTNLFELEISSGYPEIDEVIKPITMYGEGFTLPSRTQNYADVGFKGFNVPVPTNLTMEQNHSLTVRADSDGEIRRAFLAWQGKTSNPAISLGSVFEGDKRLNTAGVIRVKLLASEDSSSVSEIYKMIGVKIENVGGLQVSNADASVSTFEVSFRSIYWEIEPGTVAKGALPSQH